MTSTRRVTFLLPCVYYTAAMISSEQASQMALYLTQSIVNDPSAVYADTRGHAITLHVAPGEEGRVIGRQGRVINAIRMLVRAADPGQNFSVDLHAPRT